MLTQDRNQFLRQRTNQFLLPFSFWPLVTPRDGGNIYEIRSYFLKVSGVVGRSWFINLLLRYSLCYVNGDSFEIVLKIK